MHHAYALLIHEEVPFAKFWDTCEAGQTGKLYQIQGRIAYYLPLFD